MNESRLSGKAALLVVVVKLADFGGHLANLPPLEAISIVQDLSVLPIITQTQTMRVHIVTKILMSDQNQFFVFYLNTLINSINSGISAYEFNPFWRQVFKVEFCISKQIFLWEIMVMQIFCCSHQKYYQNYQT